MRDALGKKVSRERVGAELEGMFNGAPFLCSERHTALFLMWSLVIRAFVHCIKHVPLSGGSYRACSRCVLGVGYKRIVAHAKAQTLLWGKSSGIATITRKHGPDTVSYMSSITNLSTRPNLEQRLRGCLRGSGRLRLLL